MTTTVMAATLAGPYELKMERYPLPTDLEPGAVLLEVSMSGICGTDKHTYRGETEQYAGTDHATSTPFPIIQGHETVGVVADLGEGGAKAFDGSPLSVGDRVIAAPNHACGHCRYCVEDFPYYFCRHLKNYGNSLSSAKPPHLFGGFAEYLYLLPSTPIFKVPPTLPNEVAVLTELFAVTHSLDLVAQMPRPSGFRTGDTVAVYGAGPIGLVHAVKAALLGAGRVIAIDRFSARLDIVSDLGVTDCVLAGDDGEDTVEAVLALAEGGVDVVVDATGHPSSFLPSLRLLRDGGTLVEVGAFVDLGPVAFNPADLLGRNLTLIGVGGEDARIYDSTLKTLDDLQKTYPFERAVTHQFALIEIQEAMETALDAGDAMKVVICPQSVSTGPS